MNKDVSEYMKLRDVSNRLITIIRTIQENLHNSDPKERVAAYKILTKVEIELLALNRLLDAPLLSLEREQNE